MIDSKVILHDIYYDTYVNCLDTYPMFYTAGMCDVTYIGVYITYLHGKYFLSALYNDIIWRAPPHSKILFVSSESSPHVYAKPHSSLLRTDRRQISYRNNVWSLFTFAVNTHDTFVVSLWQASAGNASLPVSWAGTQFELVCPMKCHLLSHFVLVNGW
jgi:hypothetical protein